jgi:hypothetical protein
VSWLLPVVALACGPLAPKQTPSWLRFGLRKPATDRVGALVQRDGATIDLAQALVVHCPATQQGAETLDEAYVRFEECAGDDDRYRRRRNRLQERLISESNERCGLYKRQLQEARADAPAAEPRKGGGLAAAVGGLGMLYPPVAAVSGLARAGALVTERRDEPVRPFDAGLSTRIVLAGIDTRRANLLQSMRVRQTEDPTAYPVEAGVGDALVYHEACSVVAGLEAADEALAAADPGISRVRAEFATSATVAAISSIERAHAELRDVEERIAALVAEVPRATNEGDLTAARAATTQAALVIAERTTVALSARDRVALLSERLAATGESRVRSALAAELDTEVARALRASADVDVALARAHATVGTLDAGEPALSPAALATNDPAPRPGGVPAP